MNIKKETLQNQTVRFDVTVVAEDYNETVDKALKNYKKKANVPGFRPGMVPMSLINKMYRKSVVAEEAYKMASNACFDAIKADKINAIGDLMPSNEQKPLDFDNSTEFEFAFEIGVAPEVEISLNKKNSITRYQIEISDQMREGYKSNVTRRFGKLEDVDVVTKEEALNVILDNGDIRIEEGYVGLIGMSDAERAPFIGKKVGDEMDVNINELYKSPSQRASILSVKENELADINPAFKLTITQIRQFVTPELNEELFAQAFPDGDIKNIDEFNAKIDSQIANDLSRETDYKFVIDVKAMLMKKAELPMPEEFLKNWLFSINEGKFSMEEIEKEFPQFLDMMRWDLIKRYFVENNKIEVTEEEAIEEAKALALAQFAYYGMNTAPEDMLTNYAKSILGNKEEAQKIYDKLYERKVVDVAAEMVTVKDKAVSSEEFGKICSAEMA